MNAKHLYHSTNWVGLNSIMAEEVIKPGPLSQEDRRYNPLGKLAQKNIHFAWFSSQRWNSSKFGAYIFKVDGDGIVEAGLVPLGKYNGARCYVAAPRMLLDLLASTLGENVIDAQNDSTWRPQYLADRVDILVPWPVPAGYCLEFTSSSRKDDSGCDDREQRAKARFTAKILSSGLHQFDGSLADVNAVGEDLLSTLLGTTSSIFSKRVANAVKNPMTVETSHFNQALEYMVAGNVVAAGEAVAYYGSELAVANEVASAISTHFNQSVDGAVLYSRLPI